MRQRAEGVAEQLHVEVHRAERDRDEGVAAEQPDEAERPQGEHRGEHARNDDIGPAVSVPGKQLLRRAGDDDDLEHAPADELDDVERRREVGAVSPEQATQQHHRRRTGLCTGHGRDADEQRPQQRSDDHGEACADERERREPERHEHAERADRSEQGDAEVRPQAELVPEAENPGGRLDERERRLRSLLGRGGYTVGRSRHGHSSCRHYPAGSAVGGPLAALSARCFRAPACLSNVDPTPLLQQA